MFDLENIHMLQSFILTMKLVIRIDHTNFTPRFSTLHTYSFVEHWILQLNKQCVSLCISHKGHCGFIGGANFLIGYWGWERFSRVT